MQVFIPQTEIQQEWSFACELLRIVKILISMYVTG